MVISNGGLVQSWPEILRLARAEKSPSPPLQKNAFGAS
jgi:hypothetical protein